MKKENKSIIFAILAAALYAISTPVSKLLLENVPPAMVAAFLYLGAGIGMGLMMLIRNRSRKCQGRTADPSGLPLRGCNGRPRHRCPDSDDVRLAHQLGGQHRVAQQLRDRCPDRYGGGVLVGGEVREGYHVAHCLSIRRALRGRACPCRRTRRSCRLWLRGSRRRRG